MSISSCVDAVPMTGSHPRYERPPVDTTACHEISSTPSRVRCHKFETLGVFDKLKLIAQAMSPGKAGSTRAVGPAGDYLYGPLPDRQLQYASERGMREEARTPYLAPSRS